VIASENQVIETQPAGDSAGTEDPRRELERKIADCLVMLAMEERVLGRAFQQDQPSSRMCELADALAQYPPHREVDGWRERWKAEDALRARSQVEAAAGLVSQIHNLAFDAKSETVLNIDSREWSGPIAEGIEGIRVTAQRLLVDLGHVLSQPGDELEVATLEAESAVTQ
jgi:hypothetical protein